MTTDLLPAVGTRIESTCRPDSHYTRVRGVVTGHSNGWINLDATEVITRWNKKQTWEQHPSSCALSVKPENVVGVLA